MPKHPISPIAPGVTSILLRLFSRDSLLLREGVESWVLEEMGDYGRGPPPARGTVLNGEIENGMARGGGRQLGLPRLEFRRPFHQPNARTRARRVPTPQPE